MKKIILFGVFACVLLLPLTSVSGLIVPPHPPQIQAINVLGRRSGDVMEGMKVEPFTKIFIERYSRVYWTNVSDTPIRIKFGKGENCENIPKTSQETRDWSISRTKCYITKEPITPRETLEIYFNVQDYYDYEIQFVGTKSVLKAKLVVD